MFSIFIPRFLEETLSESDSLGAASSAGSEDPISTLLASMGKDGLSLGSTAGMSLH